MNKNKKRRDRRRNRDLRWLSSLDVLPEKLGEHRRKKIDGADLLLCDREKCTPPNKAFWVPEKDEPTRFALLANAIV